MKKGIRKSVSWGGKAVMVALIAALILPSLLIGPASVAEAKAQPALLAMAERQPEATVRVIAQKSGPSADIAAATRSLGGVVLKELSIIDAYVAEMEASAAVRLAADPAVRWVSLDGPVESTAWSFGGTTESTACEGCPANTYLDTLNVRRVWQMGYDGQGVGVAVIDSGIDMTTDFGLFGWRVTRRITFVDDFELVDMANGHGSHVAGIIGGDGRLSAGRYTGVAPGVNLYSLRVSRADGSTSEADVVEALQWVYDNRDSTNIRVVNLSLNSTTEGSYHNSPINAAAEILWLNGIVVIASAGNTDETLGYDSIKAAPANDPFVITVGASLEQGTADRGDDTIAGFSAMGKTLDGYIKPDILAPGKDIISTLSLVSNWRYRYPERTVDYFYFRLSGTSMAAPMVTGAVALMLQAEPELTPDQVKYRLMNTGDTLAVDGSAETRVAYQFPYLDVYKAVTTPTAESANTGQEVSQLLTTGSEPVNSSVSWNSVSWNSVSWNSVSWNSVSWNSVSWNSVSWNSVSWNN
jgi:serine protease AprX